MSAAIHSRHYSQVGNAGEGVTACGRVDTKSSLRFAPAANEVTCQRCLAHNRIYGTPVIGTEASAVMVSA